MIAQIVIKNFKVSGKRIFGIFFAYMLLAGIFHMKFYPWNVFIMTGNFLFVFAASYFSFVDKRNSAEFLTLSLPITKEQIVTARFITSLIVFILGLTLWFLTAYTFDNIYEESSMSFDQIFYIKVVFIAVLFFTIQQTIFLPSSFGLSFIWMVVVFIISTVFAILPIPLLFKAYRKDFNPYFTLDDFGLVLILTIIMAFMIVISFSLSNTIYKKNDL